MTKHIDLEIEVLEQKLKSAKIRRCNMIFDSLDPCFNDIIYLDEIENNLQYLHPNTKSCLHSFFQSFFSQTGKTSMNRKYFTVNILSAHQKNKFNLHFIFQDPDIMELEMRLQALKLKLNDQNDVYGNFQNISQNQEKDISSQEYTKDLPMQVKQNNFDNYSPVLQKNMEESNIQNLDQESILEQSDLPKHSQMKIGHCRKKSSRPNIFEPLLYKEEQMPYNYKKSNRYGDGVRKNIFEKLYSDSHRSKSLPTSEEVELGKCTFEPRLHKPLRSVVNKEVRPKVYDFLLDNKLIKFIKNQNEITERKSYNLNTSGSQQFKENKERENSLNQSKMKNSIELMLNANGVDLSYKDMHHRRVNYTEQRLMPEYIELTTRRINSEQQSSNYGNQSANKVSLYSLQPTPDLSTRENFKENPKILRNSNRNDNSRSPKSLRSRVGIEKPKDLNKSIQTKLNDSSGSKNRGYHNKSSYAVTAKFKELNEVKDEDSFVGNFGRNNDQYIPYIHISQPKSRQSCKSSDNKRKLKESRPNNMNLNLSNQQTFGNNLNRNEKNVTKIQNEKMTPVERKGNTPSSNPHFSVKKEYWIPKANHYLGRHTDKKKQDNKENNSYNFSFTEREVSTTHLN